MFGLYYSAALGVTIVVVRSFPGHLRAILPGGVPSTQFTETRMYRALVSNGYVKIGGRG